MANGAIQEVKTVSGEPGVMGVTTKPKGPRVRYLLGDSEKYFEPAQYLCAVAGLNSAKIKRLFSKPDMWVEETEGKSLKVLLKTPAGEVKVMGFITAGDASITLGPLDIEGALEAARTGEIKRAISAEELVALL